MRRQRVARRNEKVNIAHIPQMQLTIYYFLECEALYHGVSNAVSGKLAVKGNQRLERPQPTSLLPVQLASKLPFIKQPNRRARKNELVRQRKKRCRIGVFRACCTNEAPDCIRHSLHVYRPNRLVALLKTERSRAPDSFCGVFRKQVECQVGCYCNI